jgi:hypothetical protein
MQLSSSHVARQRAFLGEGLERRLLLDHRRRRNLPGLPFSNVLMAIERPYGTQ